MMQRTGEMGEGQPHLDEASTPDPVTAPDGNAAISDDPAAEEGSAKSMMIIPGFSEEDRFIRAAQRGELDVIKELLKEDPSLVKLEPHRNRSVYSPIEWAAMADHVPVVAYLLESGASAQACDRHGLGVLHHATMCGAKHVVTFLVRKVGVDVNSPSGLRVHPEFGWPLRHTPLHLAHMFNQPELIQVLEELGADASLRDAAGQTPTEAAAAMALQAAATEQAWKEQEDEERRVLEEMRGDDGRSLSPPITFVLPVRGPQQALEGIDEELAAEDALARQLLERQDWEVEHARRLQELDLRHDLERLAAVEDPSGPPLANPPSHDHILRRLTERQAQERRELEQEHAIQAQRWQLEEEDALMLTVEHRPIRQRDRPGLRPPQPHRFTFEEGRRTAANRSRAHAADRETEGVTEEQILSGLAPLFGEDEPSPRPNPPADSPPPEIVPMPMRASGTIPAPSPPPTGQAQAREPHRPTDEQLTARRTAFHAQRVEARRQAGIHLSDAPPTVLQEEAGEEGAEDGGGEGGAEPPPPAQALPPVDPGVGLQPRRGRNARRHRNRRLQRRGAQQQQDSDAARHPLLQYLDGMLTPRARSFLLQAVYLLLVGGILFAAAAVGLSQRRT